MAEIVVREIRAEDAAVCGRILFEADTEILARRGYTLHPDLREEATTLIAELIADPAVYGLVAVQQAKIVGSSFFELGEPSLGLTPTSIDPRADTWQVRGALMKAMLEFVAETLVHGTELPQRT